ncbi:MAG: bacterioferritin, partial [Leptospiraceae bacterium]|nr:bacterioferritin [Leptospiraceae bacterium]
ERLNKGIEICTKHHDNASRELLETILIAEEEHIDWIETQQQLINDIGLPNYLAQQI